MIGLLADSDSTITCRTREIVTRLEGMLGFGVVRVWCGLHEMDLVMQSLFKSSLCDESRSK